jgi:hypothetical protein
VNECAVIAFGLALSLTVSCATRGKAQDIDHVLYLCDQLAGPDVGKGEGEVWFGLQSERAKASQKLWSRRGVVAIDERLAVVTSDADRACLMRLKKEAEKRHIEYE